MQMNIVKEKETPLLSRKRVTLEIDYNGATPSSNDIVKELSKKLKSKEDLVEIRHIYKKFGKSKSKVIAHIYENPEVMSKIIKLGKKAKEKQAKLDENKKKAAEAPKEETPVEEAKPAEEAKETPVEEAKPVKEEAPAEEAKPELTEEPKEAQAKEEPKGE